MVHFLCMNQNEPHSHHIHRRTYAQADRWHTNMHIQTQRVCAVGRNDKMENGNWYVRSFCARNFLFDRQHRDNVNEDKWARFVLEMRSFLSRLTERIKIGELKMCSLRRKFHGIYPAKERKKKKKKTKKCTYRSNRLQNEYSPMATAIRRSRKALL